MFLKIKMAVAALAVTALAGCSSIGSYPNLQANPKINEWHRIHTAQMKASDGSSYRAFFKKGSKNKVMVYFAGGGVSVDEKSARDETYFTKLVPTDHLANLVMNMGGLATPSEHNPFADWTVIALPYATGDFHIGTNPFPYTDKNGKPRTLHHNGYVNFQAAMNEVMAKAGVANAETVLVTGYSAGGWGTALLADDVFSHFPGAKERIVFVDGSMLLKDDWKSVAQNVWGSPAHIVERIKSQDLMMDQLRHLREKWKDEVLLLFSSTTRDGDLAKVQNYFNTGKMEVDEQLGDDFQAILKAAIPTFNALNVHLFIFDDKPWYDDPRNLTSHTIIATPFVFERMPSVNQSVSQWMLDAMNGKPKDYGVELLNKTYPKTQ